MLHAQKPSRFCRISKYIEYYPVTLKKTTSLLHNPQLVTAFPTGCLGLHKTCLMSRIVEPIFLLKLEECNPKLLEKPELLASCWRKIPSTITCKPMFKLSWAIIELCTDQSCSDVLTEANQACHKIHWPSLHLRTKITSTVLEVSFTHSGVQSRGREAAGSNSICSSILYDKCRGPDKPDSEPREKERRRDYTDVKKEIQHTARACSLQPGESQKSSCTSHHCRHSTL